jgi:hypothetical protein
MELTNEEKQNIVNQHIRSIVTNLYNLEISLIAEQAVQSPRESVVTTLNSEVAQETLRYNALLTELQSLNS